MLNMSSLEIQLIKNCVQTIMKNGENKSIFFVSTNAIESFIFELKICDHIVKHTKEIKMVIKEKKNGILVGKTFNRLNLWRKSINSIALK